MDQREFHLQSMGICYRLYHFIAKTFASQALKTVTLGCSTQCSSSSNAARGDSKANKEVIIIERPWKDDDKKLLPTADHVGDLTSPAHQSKEKNKPCMNIDETVGENEPDLQPTRSIKKSVSINENVEEIPPMKKLKKKRSRSFQKSSSLEIEDEEPKPLRSILKMGSDLNDKSIS